MKSIEVEGDWGYTFYGHTSNFLCHFGCSFDFIGEEFTGNVTVFCIRFLVQYGFFPRLLVWLRTNTSALQIRQGIYGETSHFQTS